LTEEQGTFVRLFLTSRGNLTEMEKRLGVSYPTVRAKLEEIVYRLETPSVSTAVNEAPPATPGRPVAPTRDRRAILDEVARGALSPADAARALRAAGDP
jgi:hypothetical protein